MAENPSILFQLWRAYRLVAVPAGASQEQVRETYLAFLAGAASLWDLIFAALDPGDEPTAADLRRMDVINAEFGAHVDLMKSCAATGDWTHLDEAMARMGGD